MIAHLSRTIFFYASQNKLLLAAAKKRVLRCNVPQIIAGATIDHALQQVQRLNAIGLVCTLSHLGEFASSRKKALAAVRANIQIIEVIAASGASSNLSVKMTQIGLDIDRHFCVQNMKQILHAAQQHGILVCIDMENAAYCRITLDILLELRETYDNVGTVIQAYLHRAEKDVEKLAGISLRLVKGAYKELPKVSCQNRDKVNENYFHLIQKHLTSGSYTAIASHDHRIIEKVKKFTSESSIPLHQFEFQFLYGFQTDLQQQLVKQGYTVRVYVPFGSDWLSYFMRRLAARPQNAAFAFKSLLTRK